MNRPLSAFEGEFYLWMMGMKGRQCFKTDMKRSQRLTKVWVNPGLNSILRRSAIHGSKKCISVLVTRHLGFLTYGCTSLGREVCYYLFKAADCSIWIRNESKLVDTGYSEISTSECVFGELCSLIIIGEKIKLML